MSSAQTLQALVDAGLVALTTIPSPVSFRVVVVTAGAYASENSWQIKNATNKVIVEAIRNNPRMAVGSITYPVAAEDQDYTGVYTLETNDSYGDGWNGNWKMEVYSTDAAGNEILRVTTEGPSSGGSIKTDTLNVSYYTLTSPLTKATLSSMITTSPGFNLQQIIETGVVSSSDITTMFTTAEDYQLLVSPSYGSNSIASLLTIGFGGYTFLDSVLSAGAIYTHVGQVGADIEGEAANDYSGYSVSLSSDGSVVAIGAIRNDGTGSAAGHVRVFQNVSGTWTQVGADIDGEAVYDESGRSVSLSSDGSVVAIGAYLNDGVNGYNAGHVRVYQNVSGTWTQVGADIDGEAGGDSSGQSVSLSSDGSVVAIGAHNNDGNGTNSGHVRVYQNPGLAGTWTQVGADIDGEAANDYSGWSVSLSSDGSVVAIGARANGGNGYYAGHVRVYQNVSGTWTQVGADIDGEAAEDTSGWSVSLSSDGSVVAIGANANDGNGTSAGHVRVYQNPGLAGTWTQVGADIDGEAAGDQTGYSVSLSSDGSVVAIGATFNDGNGGDSGHVRVYQNVSGTWTQVGADIDGEALGDRTGWSVSLSSDGSIFAIGAYLNDGAGNAAGHTRIYSMKYASSTSELIPAGFDFSTAINVFNFSTNDIHALFYPTLSFPYTSADLTTLTQVKPSISGLITYNIIQASDVKTLLPGIDGFNALLNGSYGGGGNESYTLQQIVDYQYLTKTDIRNSYPGASGIQQLANDYSYVAADFLFLEYSITNVNKIYPVWEQIGADIDGEAVYDESGRSVSLSSDGSVVAIGAFYNDGNGWSAGHVRVFQNVSGTWTQVGADIDGEARYDYLGRSVSLSSDGSVVAIGAHGNDGTGSAAGHVRVFQNVSGTWTQVGTDIDGEAGADYSGYSVSLSSDGGAVAIGAHTNDGNGGDAGHVRVYQNVSGTWTQVGADIDGEAADDLSGRSVSLSSDGSVVAIGAYGNDGNATDAGHVRVYKNIDGTWILQAYDIDGEAANDLSGRSISLSSDGSVVAIGAPANDGTGNSAGHVRVFKLRPLFVPEVITKARVIISKLAFTNRIHAIKSNVNLSNITVADGTDAIIGDARIKERAAIIIPDMTLSSMTSQQKTDLISDVKTLYMQETGIAKNKLIVTLSEGSVKVNIDILDDGHFVPTCFPAGTPVQTDQGVTAIDKLVPGEHTLRGKNIIAITQTRPLQKHIVCFEKDSIGKNVPSQQTLCSKEHKVLYRGEMIKARDLADMCKNVKKIAYNGETLYNVLLEKHGKMLVNNMICETLHPENIAAKFAKSKNSPSKRAIA